MILKSFSNLYITIALNLMKIAKYFPLLVASLLMLFGCSKDDPQPIPELNIKEATITFNENVKFGVPHFSNIVWSSSDEFVGIVNQFGTFSAIHVGEAIVTAKVDGHTLTAKVVVEPSVTSIVEPLLNFGGSAQSIKDYEKRSLYIENSAYLIYLGRGDHEDSITYFTFNEKMTAASIHFNRGQDIIQDAVKFLTERYHYVGRTDNGRIYYESKDRSYRIFITSQHAHYTKDPYPGSSVTKEVSMEW